MSRTLSATLTIFALCASAPVFAFQAPAPAPSRGTPPAAQAATPAPAAKAADAGLDVTDANITVEISVIDKASGATTMATRLGSITVANQSNGSVRGLQSTFYQGGPQTKLDPVGLDIDARTWLRKSGLISVSLTIAYIPTGVEPNVTSIQRQSATLFLKPGQETTVLTTGMMNGPGPALKITAKATVIK